MKKSINILMTIFVIRVLVSCCDCLDSIYLKYTFDSIETVHIDNSGQNPIYINSGTIPKEAYGIQIQQTLKQIAFNDYNISGFSSAYATSCDCPPEFQYFAQDSIIGLRIITLNDFNTTHTSNSDISEYFSIYNYGGYTSISDFLNNSAIVYYEPVSNDIIEIYLMQAPEISGEHQFTVELSLSDGSVLSSTTYFFSNWGIEFSFSANHSSSLNDRHDKFTSDVEKKYSENYFVTTGSGASYSVL